MGYKYIIFGGIALFGLLLIVLGVNDKGKITRQDNVKFFFTSIVSDITSADIRRKFNGYRTLIFLLLVFLGVCVMLGGGIKKGIALIVIALILYRALKPVDFLFKFKSPYMVLVELVQKTRKNKLKNELIGLTMQLKNLLVSADEKSFSCQYVLDRILPYTKFTKPYMVNLSMLLAEGKDEEAEKMFEANFGFKQASDFVEIIRKLDTTPAYEFLPQIDLLLSTFWAERETMQEKKMEFSTQGLFLLSSIEVLLLLGDFVLVVLVDSINMIGVM